MWMGAGASGIWMSPPAGAGREPLIVWLRDKHAFTKTASSALGRGEQKSRDSVDSESCSPDVKAEQSGLQQARLGVTPRWARPWPSVLTVW